MKQLKIFQIGAGSYSVTATDENGCSGSIEVITEPENMTISVSRSSYHGEFDYTAVFL